MPQYAQYNPSVATPSPVTGWFDTDQFTYPNLPAAANLLEVTTTQWAARMANPSGWAVSAGTLVAYTPPTPTPTPAQQATTAYATYIANGLTITSTGTPALNGVYALDPTTQSDIADEAQFIGTFGEFTNGGTVALQWPLQNGTLVTFPTTAEFLALAKVTAQSVAAAKLAVGQASSTMPAATATIP